jgi:hypothetical protein
MLRLTVCGLAGWLVLAGPAGAAPLAEKYLLEGKLAEGEKALEKHLAARPDDDEARFGLAVIQFFRGFERLGAALYKHGLKTSSTFEVIPAIRRHIPENPSPEKLSYTGARKIVQAWVEDLGRAGATLDRIRDDKVKLPLHVGRIQLDLFGVSKPVSAAMILGATGAADQRKAAEGLVIGFDRGDACWLRGYCHFLAAWGETLLALDTRELFECTAHRFFARAETPHRFLQEEDTSLKGLELRLDSFPQLADVAAFLHLCLRVPVKEPARLKAVLGHLEGLVANGKRMWKFILAETDDDNEWIPNPKQTGVVGVRVTQEMVDNWLATLDEVEQLLQGKKLLPFWRGKAAGVGVNLRKAFTEPAREFDLVRWVQGTAATPYLEKGPITGLADRRTIARLDRAFGGFRFFGFAFWFN